MINLAATTPAQRVKLGLIPLLLAVFGWVLWDSVQPVVDAVAELADAHSAGSAAGKSAILAQQDGLPKYELAELLAHNPFVAPGAVPALAEAEEKPMLQPQLAAGPAPTDKVNVPPTSSLGRLHTIVGNGTAAIAHFEQGLIHTGDVLPGGYRVVEIRPDAVIFEREK